MMEWQPIETAPAPNGGDTKAVLVYCPDIKCTFTAWWKDNKEDGGIWTYFGAAGRHVINQRITHWMPLSEPPEGQE